MFNWPKSNKMKIWDKIYQKWKTEHPLITELNRRIIVRQCVKKFAYDNFLDLLKEADQLSKDETFVEGRYINIYQCEVCGKGHIGNQRTPPDIGYDWWFEVDEIWIDDPIANLNLPKDYYKKFYERTWVMEEKDVAADRKSRNS